MAADWEIPPSASKLTSKIAGSGGSMASAGSRHDLEEVLSRNRAALTHDVMLATQAFGARYGIGNSELAAYLHLALAARSGTPVRPTDLRDSLHLSGAAVTYVIERLVGRGLARRVPDPADRRTYTVEVTAEGRDVVADADDQTDRRVHTSLTDLSDDDIHAARRVIHAMTTATRRFRAELDARNA